MSTSVPTLPQTYSPTVPLLDQRMAPPPAYAPPPFGWPRPGMPGAPTARATGDFSQLLGILIAGHVLTLLTLGVYRFWLKTNIRRWYWSNTVIGADPFEYTGTGREIFIGFLIAVGVILPIYGLLVWGTWATGLLEFALSTKVFILVVMVLTQYARYRGRRYQMTRTTWRGLSFSQHGDAWTYAWWSVLATAVGLATLGLATPWVRAVLEGYKVRHTHFGTARGSFAPRLAEPATIWLVLWVPVLAMMGGALWHVSAVGALGSLWDYVTLWLGLSVRAPATPLAAGQTALGLLVLATLASAAWWFLVWPAYRVAEFKAFTNGTRIGPVGFVVAPRKRWYYWAVARFALLAAFLGGMIVGLAALTSLAVLGMLGERVLATPVGQFAAGATGIFVYLVGLIVMAILREIVLVQGFWRHALSNMTVTGLEGVDAVVARGQADRGFGEGLADALGGAGF